MKRTQTVLLSEVDADFEAMLINAFKKAGIDTSALERDPLCIEVTSEEIRK